MSVMTQLQAEMSERPRAVEGLRLGTQNRLSQNGLHSLVVDVTENGVKIPWLGVGRQLHPKFQGMQEFAQFFTLLHAGRLMDAMDQASARQFLGNSTVGGNHELFNQAMGIQSENRLHPCWHVGFP